TATLLTGGKILVTGGTDSFGPTALAELFLPGAKPCAPVGTATCPWHDGDVVSFNQSAWAEQTTATGLLNQNFNSVYATTVGLLEVGIGFSMIFTEAFKLLEYLPASGFPGALTGDVLDPSATSAGIFGGNVTGLRLNIDFSDAGVILGDTGL